MAKQKKTYDQTMQQIVKEHLNIDTLKERGLDRLDFHDCGVASIASALTAAYLAGAENALEFAKKATEKEIQKRKAKNENQV